MVQLLLDRGADPNKVGPLSRTPLHNAVSRGHVGVGKMLIKRGAKVDHADEDGITPLHEALFNCNNT